MLLFRLHERQNDFFLLGLLQYMLLFMFQGRKNDLLLLGVCSMLFFTLQGGQNDFKIDDFFLLTSFERRKTPFSAQKVTPVT